MRIYIYSIEDDPFKGACLHARRSGDARVVIAMLRNHWRLNEWDQEMLADLLQGAKLKRPRGNPRGKDPWVAMAVAVAREHKQRLHRLNWKKSKGGPSLLDVAIDSAIGYMQYEYPMRPKQKNFRERVHTELRRARRK